jgi:hypothetical protein
LPAYKPVLDFQRDGQKTLGQFRRLSQREATIDSHQAILGEYRLELKDKADADHRFLAFRPEDVQLHRTGSFDGQTNALAGGADHNVRLFLENKRVSIAIDNTTIYPHND